MEEADLLGSLQLLKEFFLLGRGEVYLTFLDTANSFMKLPPTHSTEHGQINSYNSCTYSGTPYKGHLTIRDTFLVSHFDTLLC